MAIVWTLHEDIVLFAEDQANNRRSVFGRTLNNVGERWWVIRDRFGLDLTATREAGAAGRTAWTLGFGWYGLQF